MKNPFTYLVMLEAVSDKDNRELAAAIESKKGELDGVKGFISKKAYACQESSKYLFIHQWESEGEMNSWRETQANCPIGKLIEAGRVKFDGGPVTQLQ